MKIKNYKEWDYTLILVALVIVIAMISSCRTVTVQQAANGKAKCGKWLK